MKFILFLNLMILKELKHSRRFKISKNFNKCNNSKLKSNRIILKQSWVNQVTKNNRKTLHNRINNSQIFSLLIRKISNFRTYQLTRTKEMKMENKMNRINLMKMIRISMNSKKTLKNKKIIIMIKKIAIKINGCNIYS